MPPALLWNLVLSAPDTQGDGSASSMMAEDMASEDHLRTQQAQHRGIVAVSGPAAADGYSREGSHVGGRSNGGGYMDPVQVRGYIIGIHRGNTPHRLLLGRKCRVFRAVILNDSVTEQQSSYQWYYSVLSNTYGI